MRCIYCGKPAIYYRKYAGEALCKNHFTRSIEKKVLKTIREYLHPGIRIGLEVSGDKNSLVMSYITRKITKREPKTVLLAILIDENISRYREHSIKYAKEFLNRVGIPYKILSFRDYYGIGLDDIAKKIKDPNLICSYCRTLRTRLVDLVSIKNDIEVIFKGYDADDIALNTLLSVVKGDLHLLTSKRGETEEYITRVYPLKFIREEEITLYAEVKKISYYSRECPYLPSDIYNEVKLFLKDLEKRRQGIVYNILGFGKRLQEYSKRDRIGKCKNCNFPSIKEICSVCSILDSLGLKDRIIRFEDI